MSDSQTILADARAVRDRLAARPYLILFPTGLLLTLIGVGHWLLHAIGWLHEYRPTFHALAQVQGFLTCFAVGFLFTMVPRRTESAPVATWQIALAVVAPLSTAAAAWARLWVWSQLAWLVLAVTVTAFLLQRFLGPGSGRRPPTGFVWIPVAWLMGIGGSVATVVAALGVGPAWLHPVGRGLVLQGMFTALVLGVGTLALPLMTRGVGPPDATGTGADLAAILAHVAGGLTMAGSFWVERAWDFRLGPGLRGAIALLVLLGGIRLWRPPTRPGWNARLIRLAAWMVPAGYLLVAAFPSRYLAGLHVTLIGGFALLALAVGMQVTLGHGGRTDLQRGRPWQVPAMGALVLGTVLARALMDLDFRRRLLWMAVASALFLVACLLWATFLTTVTLDAGNSDRARGSGGNR